MEPDEYRRMFELETRYWWFLAKRALVQRILARYGDGPVRVGIDVGCGTGGVLQALATDGGTWIGMDYSDLALACCRKRGLARALRASAEALPFRAGAVDAVLCLDVLYHRGVESEGAVLGECARVLRPGGTLIVTDSALEWLRGPHDEAVHGRRRYRLGELAALVEAPGFRVLRRTYTSALVFPATAAYRLLRRVLPGPAARADLPRLPWPAERLLAGLMATERGLLSFTNLPVGSSVLVVARKP